MVLVSKDLKKRKSRPINLLLHFCHNGFVSILPVLAMQAHMKVIVREFFSDFDLESNHKPILNPIVHETRVNNHMRPFGQECNKQSSLL
jgi:hypothetical protein